MPSFAAGWFAIAGAIAAAAPFVIHLLNRRRYRVVQWAAMDLLRESITRSRRILQLRDILLLALRTLCVLLFAFALARPFYSTGTAAGDLNQPVHAVLIVDNSLSMGYQGLGGTLLDEAKARLNEYLDRLPVGSHISVLPQCGAPQAYSHDVHRTISDAREALARIEVVDRTATFAAAVDLAREACALDPEMPTKRVVLIGDQQRLNWPAGGLDEALGELPDLQVVQVASDAPQSNAWIADFRVQDDVADVETPTVFTATIRYDGPGARKDVEVGLSIEGARVAAQTIDLEPGQSRQVRFTHRFDLPVEPGEPAFVAATLSIAPDQLPGDDARHIEVPVVAALPVVFVDQYGAAGEDPQKNRYGETFHLRRLLAPVSSRTDSIRQLVSVRHVSPDQLERQHLEDCRLVVVAGVENSLHLVPILREYVEQGGRLVVAAGGSFDPALWSNAAWLDGAGILPLPLKPEPIGRLPDESARELDPFFLAPDSLNGEEFQIEDASREELDDLYRTPLFFKAVAVETGDEVTKALREADIKRILDARERRKEVESKKAAAEAENNATLPLKAADGVDVPFDNEPRWLLWATDAAPAGSDDSPESIATREQPRVLASFSNGAPFVVDRKVGRGEIIFISTGVLSGWNNLTRTNAVVVYDRLLRGMLARTLPRRNYGTEERPVIAVLPADRRADFALIRPSGEREMLFVDAVGPDRFAITLRNLTERGEYRLFADKPVDPAAVGKADTARHGPDRLWQIDLAVNGQADESDLKTINDEEFHKRVGTTPVRWVERVETIGLEGSAVRGQETWKWLMAAALVCLLAELAILAHSHGKTVTTPHT